MNAEKIKKLYYFTVDTMGERATFAQQINLIDEALSEALECIPNIDLRLEIDGLIGKLILAHEYKGFEIGMKSRPKKLKFKTIYPTNNKL